MKRSHGFLMGVILLGSLFQYSWVAADTAAAKPEPRKGWNFKEFELTPIQSGGRLKPMSTFTREVVLFETGKTEYSGWSPSELLIAWLSAPEQWQGERLIRFQNLDAKRQLGLDEKESRFSYVELTQKSHLGQYVEGLARPGMSNQSTPIAKVGTKSDPREEELKSVLRKIEEFRSVVSGEIWTLIPLPDPQKPWLSIAGNEPEGAVIRESFAKAMVAYRKGDQAVFEASTLELRKNVESQIQGYENAAAKRIQTESLYNIVHPFYIAWILYFTAGIILIFAKGVFEKAAQGLLALGFASHISGIAMRVYIADRPPVTNMYESIIWVSFGVILFSGIVFYFQRQKVIFIVSSFLATLGLIAADAAPAMIDPGIHPLVAVLRSNYWLTIHVLTITISYSALALTLGVSNVTLFQFLKDEKGQAKRIVDLNQLTYRAMQFGVVLLAAGIILGGVWADYSWGRFWGWDPKEVWALIALLGYLAILHSRYTGWVGSFGYPALTIVSFLGVVMAWYGVNFVLGVGLHSYGFSAGGQGVVAVFCLVQLAYVGWIAFLRKRRF